MVKKQGGESRVHRPSPRLTHSRTLDPVLCDVDLDSLDCLDRVLDTRRHWIVLVHHLLFSVVVDDSLILAGPVGNELVLFPVLVVEKQDKGFGLLVAVARGIHHSVSSTNTEYMLRDPRRR